MRTKQWLLMKEEAKISLYSPEENERDKWAGVSLCPVDGEAEDGSISCKAWEVEGAASLP